MLARLGAGHINIVRPLEIVLTSRHLAFITEYVPGEHVFSFVTHRSVLLLLDCAQPAASPDTYRRVRQTALPHVRPVVVGSCWLCCCQHCLVGCWPHQHCSAA
jgi:hypothetical protein